MKVFLLTGLTMLGFLAIGAESTNPEDQAWGSMIGILVSGVCLCKLQSLLGNKSDK